MSDFCRTCKTPVLWTITPTGAKAPIDGAVDETGNVLVLTPTGIGLLSVVLSGEALELARRNGVRLRLSHWASCPDRQEWREKTDAKATNREGANA
jgi:hypothetical protein